MKQLHEYETPETEEAVRKMDALEFIDYAKSLEQRLACAVEALEAITMFGDQMSDKTAQETLNIIKQ